MYVRMYVYTYNIDTMLLNGLQLLHTYKLLGSSKPPWAEVSEKEHGLL